MTRHERSIEQLDLMLQIMRLRQPSEHGNEWISPEVQSARSLRCTRAEHDYHRNTPQHFAKR